MARDELKFGQLVRLTKELEVSTGFLRKGTIFTVTDVKESLVYAITGSGEHQLPIEHVAPI